MQLKAVSQYKEPGYPVQEYLREHPELLRLVPKRWRGNATVLAVLGMAAMLIASCKASDASGNTKKITHRVAPIFIHGEGRGGFGCVAVNPPVVFSEDEARQIIINEAQKSGLQFSDTVFSVPLTNGKSVVLDGYDEAHRIGFEFISPPDDRSWCIDWSDGKRQFSSAWSVALTRTADELRSKIVVGKESPTIGILYDPLISFREEMAALSDSERADYRTRWTKNDYTYPHCLGEQELRAQVRDFIQWLKAQGII